MKLSSKILLAMLVILIAGMLSSNIILKKEYEKLDKSDLYWTYRKVIQQPFKYLKIKGGNITSIAFEQSRDCSVRILEEWARYHNGSIKAVVKNDTLFIDFNFIPGNTFEKYWMRTITAVRIFSPQLLYVDCFDTRLEMFKMKQKSYNVSIAGRSSFEVESMQPDLDSLNVSQKDSSEVVFEMSPEYKSPPIQASKRKIITADNSFGQITIAAGNEVIKSSEAMTLRSLIANVQGNSLLDIGHAQIGLLQLHIADSSGIILSGGALKKVKYIPGKLN
ncbi:MAG: hypothetical protein ABI834_04060 [Ginsengibacter sp.]